MHKLPKQILRAFAMVTFVGLVCTGCQKDENLVGEKSPEWKEIVMEKSFPIQKVPYTKIPRTLFLKDVWGQAQACRAVTFTDVPTGKQMEWLFVDARSTMFNVSYLHSAETYTDDMDVNYALDHGGYYEWAINFSATTSWDGIVYADEALTIPVNGFRIPTYANLNKLGSIIGSTSIIPVQLKMAYDGFWSNYSNYHFSTDIAAMWVYTPGDRNQVSGCGVAVMWKKSNNNEMTGLYTNMTNLGANIRIVRDIE